MTISMIAIMTAGTAVIMWLGELITDRGVGNGMSLMIFTSIIAGFPGQLSAIYSEPRGLDVPGGHRRRSGGGRLRRADGAGAAADPGAVRQAHGRPSPVRRLVHVHPDQGEPGRRHPGHLRVVDALPAGALRHLEQQHRARSTPGSRPTWCNGSGAWYAALFFALTVFFTYFYVAITFNSDDIADNMKKYGGFIPGIRAGRPTAEYLDYVLTPADGGRCRSTWPPSPSFPIVVFASFGQGQNFLFGGTSILIMVGVGLDTVKQIESQLQQRSYEGFLR